MQFEQPAPGLVIVIRSLVFNVAFYVNLVVFLFGGSFFLLTPRKWSIRALQAWARTTMWLMKLIVGTRVEFRGVENIPKGACLLVGKHQSLWETFALLSVVDDPAIVHKHDLVYIPLFGWFALKFELISVDRGKGGKALRSMLRSATEKIKSGRQILIFPEGSRKGIGQEPDYKPGATALYKNLNTTTVPFGLNSGLYWPRRKFLRWPGTIIVEFGKPIPAGLDRKAFADRSQADIETLTSALVSEGIEKDFGVTS